MVKLLIAVVVIVLIIMIAYFPCSAVMVDNTRNRH